MNNSINIYHFNSYRDFLKNIIKNKPRKGWGVLGQWAKDLNVSSTFVSQVISGKKDFSVEQTLALAEVLKLNPMESRFIILLLERERAGTIKLKNFISHQIDEIREQQQNISNIFHEDKKLSDIEMAEYYSSWIYSAIRLYASLDKGCTTEQIYQKFPQINPSRIDKVMTFLIQTQLCQMKDTGQLIRGPGFLILNRQSPHFSKNHTQWRLRSMDRAEDLSEEEVMTTFPMIINKKTFIAISRKLADFLKNTVEDVKSSNAEDLACLNLDFFWINSVSKPKQGPKK